MKSTLKIIDQGSEFLLTSEQWVPRDVDTLFSFFGQVKNLEVMTPSFVGFQVLDVSTPEIGAGTLIRYRLKVHGLPMGWTTRIESWDYGRSFVDTQLRGPYALWHHTHTFEPREGGTLMKDVVRFRLPFGALGKLFGIRLVKRDLNTIFRFRQATIERLFPKNPKP